MGSTAIKLGVFNREWTQIHTKGIHSTCGFGFQTMFAPCISLLYAEDMKKFATIGVHSRLKVNIHPSFFPGMIALE
jgi:hypothetical protein